MFLPNIIWIGLELEKLSQKVKNKKGELFIETQCIEQNRKADDPYKK